jgi:hypothetical protein
MSGTFTLDASKVGTVIETAGVLQQISYDAPPSQWQRLAYDTTVGSPRYGLPTSGAFCLVDVMPDGTLNPIYNLDVFSNGAFTPGNASYVSIPFTQLALQAIPPGSVFTVTTA